MSQWLGIAFHPVEVGLVPIRDTAGVSHGIQQRLHICTMSGVHNIRPVGRMRPAGLYIAARQILWKTEKIS